MKPIYIKILLIFFGVCVTLSGLYLTFGFLIYSQKEKDDNGFYGIFLSVSLFLVGLLLISKGLRFKK
jgi:hypothetical protein